MTDFYNDIDPYAAQWLENLIAAGHIPGGHVERRSIKELTANDLEGYSRVHLFAGIGGWPLAFRLAGFPSNESVWSASFPCQPFSVAGLRKGAGDDRHLWPWGLRLIEQRRPAIIFGEQVASKDGRQWLAGIRADLEALGYEVGASDLCAAGAGSPHIRQRLYWVAYRKDGDRRRGVREAQEGIGTDGIGGGRSSICSVAGGLVDTINAGLEGFAGNGDGGNQSGRDGSDALGSATTTGGARRVVDSDLSVEYGRPSGRQQQVPDERDERDERNSDFWREYDILHCTDNKSRRVESGTFPLANGVPSRMGKLRAYGNAIVPQVAAQFIKAFLECR